MLRIFEPDVTIFRWKRGLVDGFRSFPVFRRWIFEGCLGFDGVSTPAEFLATFAANLTRTPGLSS